MVTSSYFMNLPIELKRELRLFAIDHDTTMSEIIVLSLKSYFRENQYSSEELAKMVKSWQKMIFSITTKRIFRK